MIDYNQSTKHPLINRDILNQIELLQSKSYQLGKQIYMEHRNELNVDKYTAELEEIQVIQRKLFSLFYDLHIAQLSHPLLK